VDARLRIDYPDWFKSGEGKGRLKSITEEIKEIDKYWSDIIYTVCKGDISNMREIVKLDIYDFFGYVDNFKKGIKDANRSRT
jgi:hypothetical protein